MGFSWSCKEEGGCTTLGMVKKRGMEHVGRRMWHASVAGRGSQRLLMVLQGWGWGGGHIGRCRVKQGEAGDAAITGRKRSTVHVMHM
jgi:hypothetical protein